MYLRHSTPWFKKVVIHSFLATFFASFLPMAQVSEALSIINQADPSSTINPGGGLENIRSVGSVETRYGLVAILVEEDMWDSTVSSGGGFFGSDSISEKIETYASDIQATLPWTKTLIITVSEDDSTPAIQRLLERLYFQGNPEDSDPTKLSGVVLVGDVPLPVVNKGGHRFISLLPYTDFEEPSYLLEADTQDFVPNEEAQNLQAEVWHGVIVPPLDGQEGVDLLGAYFDKNHSFHTGDEDYTTFNEKVFIGDFVTEESTINPTAYASYSRFIGLWEELTYYRYTNDLVEQLYTEMATSIEAGDFLDNDQDGYYDEEASNGIDDDSDGLVDEDLGDGFFGVDNDGDCSSQSASLQDSNGDGKPCFKGTLDEDGNWDVEPDSLVDEDGSDDNNNDEGWIVEIYAEGDAAMFEDRMVDEDPPGDTTGGEDADGDGVPDGDGCPGLCGVDDNGDGEDHDGDGYPTGIEILFRYDPFDERSPWPRVYNWTNDYFGTSYDNEEDATAYLSAMFVDTFFDGLYEDPTCFEGSTFHPEWDDDEDGFCDEDGSDQLITGAAASAFGLASGTCAYNDADCDGEIDEDPIGLQPEGLFDDLPDIQAKSVVETLISRYAEMFDQPQGVWNRLVAQTGRYETRESDGESVSNDYDTAISLISKKDELTLQGLTAVNDYIEQRLNEIVEDSLADEIPVIAALQIRGDYTLEDDDEEDEDEPEPEDFCESDHSKDADLEGDTCLQFVNHTGYNQQIFDDEGELNNIYEDLTSSDYYINGQPLSSIDSPKECTNFAGTYEEDGQLSKFNTLYSREFSSDEDHQDLDTEEVEEYRNCIPEFLPYVEDIPYLCSTVTARQNTRELDGSKVPTDEELEEYASRWETGPEACFEFREIKTFNDYTQGYGEFNDWLTTKIRKFREDGADDEASYEEFLTKVEEYRLGMSNIPGEVTLRKHFSELDMMAAVEDSSYTVIDLMEELGYEDVEDDDVDVFIAAQEDDDEISIDNPQEGSGMGDVDEINIYFDKLYLADEGTDLVDDEDDAEYITSVYYGTEPKIETLNAQIQNAGSPNLPIDASRHVKFIDHAGESQILYYPNVFDATTVADVEAAINELAEAVEAVSGGSSFKSEVEGFYEELNLDQLEDALEWRFLSIDEKHRYVLTHYLGTEEPIFAKARDGYEVVSLIADGDASTLYFAFNGDKPETEGDLEFKYRSQELIEEALAEAAADEEEEEYEPLSEVSNTTPVLITEWIAAMEEWLKETEDSLTSLDTEEEETYCGEAIEFTSGTTEDSDGSGIPDGADATVSLVLSSDDNEVLQAGGKDYYTVSVSAEKSDGSINTEDSYTQVELSVTSGTDSITITGNSSLTLTGGVATFTLVSGEAGSFTLQAAAANREDLSGSNTLSGTVETKFVKVTTYTTEEQAMTGETTTETTSRIEVSDADGNIVAILDPETGDLELRDALAEILEAEDGLPTRIAISSETGTVYAVFFLIPEVEAVSIGEGTEGVFVKAVGASANAASSEGGVTLEDGGVEMGLVTALGQIAVADGYTLEFENPDAVNVYDPIHVVDSNGETVFTVTIEQTFTTGEILDAAGSYADYLSMLRDWPLGKRGEVVYKNSIWKNAFASLGVAMASSILDTDSDLLDDLEEWTISTDYQDSDTDGDSYEDGLEIFSGYSPLESGEKLFSDISADHEAYHDLAVLYLRGVIKGYSDGTFRPDNEITREEFVKIDLGAICKDCDSYNADYESALLAEYELDPFPDTDINSELLACVAEAKVGGIVSGYASGAEEGYFVPKRYISRAEATKVLVETGGYDVSDAAEGEKWYQEYVDTAESIGLFPDGATVNTEWLEGYITRAEFVMMAVNLIEAKDCRDTDTDGEGLSDTEEEVIHGTDPTMPDTDLGGVNDLDEVLRGSDPLDASDDFPTEGDNDDDDDNDDDSGEETTDETAEETAEDFSSLTGFDHEPGLYAVSNLAAYEEVSTSTGEGSTTVNLYTNDVAADGESTLYVRAEIRDQDDNIYVDDSTSIIEFILSSSEYGEVSNEKVQVQNGYAETVFTTTQIAGDLTVMGLITDGSLPSQNADIHVYPGEPGSLELAGESTVLPAGGEAVSDMTVYLYDSYGNLAYNGFYTVTLTTDGGLTLLDLADEDTTLEGTQVTTADGYLSFRVLASTTTGTSTVSASLPEVSDGGDTFSIDHKEGLTLKVEGSSPYLFVGSSTGETATVTVVDENGVPITGFQGDVSLRLTDPSYGTFASDSLTLSEGQASTTLTPGTLAGTGSIIAESAGIEGGSEDVTLKPEDTYELRIRKEDGTTVLSAGETETLIIEAYDVYGNLVTTDSSTTGTLRTTETTEEFASIGATTFTLNQGKARVSVTPEDVSGLVNLVASSTGLLAGTWSGEINYSVSGEELAEMDFQMLYGSVLGAPFGDVTEEDYVAGWMLFNGKTQAVTSLVSEPKPKKRLATIDSSGAITLPEDTMVTQTVFGAGSELPTTIQWREFPDDVLLAELFYVLDDNSTVSATLLTANDDFTLEETDDAEVLIREEAAAAVKIRSDGQILILDPTYSLVVNGSAEALGFVVLKNTEQIARIDFDSPWTGDTEAVDSGFSLEDYDSLSSGVYLKPTAASENNVVTIPSGNSSQSPMGLAMVDPDEDIDKAMQPSLGYQSLEAAEDDGNIGWENENKHLLLFSAGNTVGQSNLYYVSEVGVVLGDPTIKLTTENVVNDLGFTSDVGTQVSASQEEILTLMNLDYNGDDMEDVLVAYTDGRIEVLQNAKAPVRLANRGELLFIESGISSIDKGDFNDDGLEDLLIVTEEACYEGEICLYVYENIGGGFVAENLALSGIGGKPTQVEVADLNNDDYDDLVIVDENMVLYTVWNAEGTLSDVTEEKNFGLNTDSTQNLYGDLTLRYDGLEEGSVSLTLVTGSTSASDLAAEDDYDLTINGGDSSSIPISSDVAFEYADNEDLAELFTVTKTVNDEDSNEVEVGDTLTYTITVQNNSSSTYSSIYISDLVSPYFSFNEDSFACSDCSGSPSLVDGDSTRPFIYGPVSLTGGVSFTATYTVTVDALPALSVMVGQDIYTDYTDDDFVDLAISPEGNDSGELLLFYSDGYVTVSDGDGFLGVGETSYERITYTEKTYSPETYEEYETETTSLFPDSDEDGIPDFAEEMDPDLGIPVAADGEFDPISELMGGKDTDGDGYYSSDEMFDSDEDADNDGLLDTIDLWVSGSDVLLDAEIDLGGDDASFEASVSVLDEEISGIADKVEEIVGMFTCNGGCLALPGSVAFLAPGTYHMPITGTTISFDPGTPIFGILPYLPVVCTGQMCYGSNVMRLYLAPTTTLGIGLGICLGPYGAGQCFAFNLPILQLLGVCDALNGFIADGLSQATAFISGGGSSAYNVDSSPESSNEATGLESAIFESYAPPVTENLNVQVPGFPSIFTEWWKAQKEEFFKMLDLPDITFIYPDPSSIGTEFTGIRQKALENDVQLEGDGPVVLDHELKLEEMTGGVLGLEKWLNMAHALPLIDIKPEKVQIRYPAITKEEIEIIKRDWEDWLEDTKNEWERFKEDFDVRDDLTDAQKETLDEIEAVINEAITAVEANLAILESYTEIPEKILILRDIQAYYAKAIICYLDAILTHTAGYLSENVERIEAWAQFIVDLQTIVDGWQVLIDLSADLMDSCDKCTNQRYSGMQLLFSLFVFVPEFPVVEMPKLPDITVDVSNIQAGVDIVWPDIDFVPERIDIPELPRIPLPSGDISGDLEFDLTIPTLPEFDINFEIPELPGLTIPDLPSLPPPPAIPELDPSISAALNIASSVLRIVCIIRQGFVPTTEFTLKAKIEEITERPGGIVLPFDTALTVEWPEFSFDYAKEVQINTYLNLTADFSSFYDIVKAFADDMNEETSKFVQESINKPLDELSQEILEVIDVLDIEINVDVEAEAEADLEEGEVDANAEGEVDIETEDSEESSFDEAMSTALAYKDNPMVKDRLTALKQALENMQKEFTAWDEAMPDEISLVATSHTLSPDDPLLNRYDEVIQDIDLDQKFLASIEDTPLASVAQLRNSLISYVEDFEQGTIAMKGMDSESFQRYLAEESVEPTVLLASEESGTDFSTSYNWNPQAIVDQFKDDSVELASESSLDSALGDLSLGVADAYDSGIYLYNAELGINTRLTDYNQEADEAVSILFVDLDDDGDDDIVYSMGGDVYVKENHTEEATLSYVTEDPGQSTVPDMDPTYGSVHNFKRGKNDYEEASFSFSGDAEALGYEVVFYDSLDAQEAEPEENLKRLLLVSEEETESETVIDTSGVEYQSGALLPATEDSNYKSDTDTEISVPAGSEFELPELKSSRLRADDVSGKVKLLNAPQRTLISSSGELEVDDGVLFQALEDTVLEVTIEDYTMTLSLPAYQLIQFGREADRVIRVDSGSVYWIEETTIVEEQDVEAGMEIFSEEMVSLQSSGADAVLLSGEGAEIELDKEEVFVMDRLFNAASPSSSIEIENGAYYTTVRSLNSDGSFGTKSDNVLLNPQVCADDSAPYPLIDSEGTSGDGAEQIAIFATKEISAEASFDSDSEIVDAYWDLDDTVDADGNGILNDDEEAVGLTAEIGPYDTLDPRVVTLTIVDAAGNTASAEVNVEVYVPDIEITEATVDLVTGTTDPESPGLPFHLIRDRNGVLSEIGTGYTTDDAGDFSEEMINSDLIAVYDANLDVIAEFNPVTKQVIVYDSAYDVAAVASESDWPSRLVVYEVSSGIIMGSFIFVGSNDLNIATLSEPLENYELSEYGYVTVYSVSDEEGYEFNDESITAHDDYGNLDFMLSETGNITIFDDRYTLVKREADSLDDYLILEIYDEGVLELEIWPGTLGDAQIVTTQDLDLSSSSILEGYGESLSEDTRLYFEDISTDDPLYEDIAELVERGVLEGYEVDGLRYFYPDQAINRAEFTKIILSILCIVPSAEAEILPSVFNDILDSSLWYFPYTKEAFIRDLITGYLGELDSSGVAPFKPENTITRAEAVKIVLEALDKEEIISLPDDLSGEPWYDPYMEIAQDLSPYMTGESTAGTETYIITAEEAADPGHEMTRYEFVEMSVRVLQAYNCFDLDSDGDGLINYDEEAVYGTDPYNPDTDSGGVDDGTEVGRDTDPLDGEDDFGDTAQTIESGIYAVTEVCSACPCTSSMDFEADLKAGDSVFAIIKNEDGEIFEVSPSVEVTE